MSSALNSLDDLILAGDHTSWHIEDWKWDHLNLTASPVSAADAASASGCGKAKRPRVQGNSTATSFSCQAGDVDLWPCQAEALAGTSQNSAFSDLLPDTFFTPVGAEQSCASAETNQLPTDASSYDPTLDGTLQGKRASSSCQVEGCGRSLKALTTYHQRCHICEVHIKMPSFERQGTLQRFCQRCGRCHEVSAFDGARRSCREQLAKHNARRRRRTDALEGEHQPPSLPACQAACAAVPHLAQPLAGLQAAVAPGCQPGAGSMVLGTPVWPALEAPAMGPPSSQPCMPPPPAPAAAAAQGSSFDQALQLMGQSAPGILAAQPHGLPVEQYQPSTFVSRLSVKLFNCVPGNLPLDLRDKLTGWLHSTPAGAEGYIRAGCVHLTVDLLLSAEQRGQAGMRQLLQHLLHQAHAFGPERTALVQLGRDLALLKGSTLVASWALPAASSPTHAPLDPANTDNKTCPTAPSLSHSDALPSTVTAPGGGTPHLTPHLESVQPVVVVCGPGAKEPPVRLVGAGLRCEDCTIVCRLHGQHLAVKKESHAPCCQAGSIDQGCMQELTIQLPSGSPPGLAWLEVQRGALLSPAQPVLLVPDAGLAAEAQSLLAPQCSTTAHSPAQALLVDLGLALRAHYTGLHACPLEPGPLALSASRLLAHACDAGAPRIVALLLEVAEAAALAAHGAFVPCVSTSSPSSLSLLHRAVRSGSAPTVQALLSWSQTRKWPLHATAPGPGGITALHLAALHSDGGALARLLCSAGACQPSAWFQARAHDGLTPHDFAARLRDASPLDAWFQQRLQPAGQALPPQHRAAPAPPPPAQQLPPPDGREAVGMAGPSAPVAVQHARAGQGGACWDEEAAVSLPPVPPGLGRLWQAPAVQSSVWPYARQPRMALLAAVACLGTCMVLLRV